jgi:hypothetical protein
LRSISGAGYKKAILILSASLIEAFRAVAELTLPKQFLEKVTGQRIFGEATSRVRLAAGIAILHQNLGVFRWFPALLNWLAKRILAARHRSRQ